MDEQRGSQGIEKRQKSLNCDPSKETSLFGSVESWLQNVWDDLKFFSSTGDQSHDTTLEKIHASNTCSSYEGIPQLVESDSDDDTLDEIASDLDGEDSLTNLFLASNCSCHNSGKNIYPECNEENSLHEPECMSRSLTVKIGPDCNTCNSCKEPGTWQNILLDSVSKCQCKDACGCSLKSWDIFSRRSSESTNDCCPLLEDELIQAPSPKPVAEASVRGWDDGFYNNVMFVLYQGLDDWDIIQSSDVSYHRNSPYSPKTLSPMHSSNPFRPRLKHNNTVSGALGHVDQSEQLGGAESRDESETRSLLQNPIEETLSRMSRALNIGDRRDHGFRYLVPPLKDVDFRKFLDEDGCLIKPEEMRLLVYQIGIEHSLRKVVWKHLLNVYPTKPRNLTGAERYSYMKMKCEEYYSLKKRWQNMNWENKKAVVTSIRKDVLRTDRSHAFFSDIEIDFEKTPTNPHLTSLFDILMTFAMSFPQISYCQGMSDLASPLLLIMQDEAVTYVCFCALMRRLQQNFTVDSLAMHIKFDHLKLLLKHVDKEFYDYLSNGSDSFELFFCYRWLLLEMKREFALDDALLMLEVMWASIPPDPPDIEIKLANDNILEHLDQPVSAFQNVLNPSDSQKNSSIMNRLNPLDAANADLINWSMEQNRRRTSATSEQALNFDHLRSKQDQQRSPVDVDYDLDSLGTSHRGSCSYSSEIDDHSHLQCHCGPCERLSNGAEKLVDDSGMATSGETNRFELSCYSTSESTADQQCLNSAHHLLNSDPNNSTSEDTATLSKHRKDSEKPGRCLSHSNSCPSIDFDEVSDTSDLGTTESSIDNSCINSGVFSPSIIEGSNDHNNASSSVESNNPEIKKNRKSSIPGNTSAASPASDLKRAKSDMEVSPNSKKQSITKDQSATVFSYDFVPSSNEDDDDYSGSGTRSDLKSAQNGHQAKPSTKTRLRLPPPAEFGCGNPFLLFMCVTLIVQQKQKIIGKQMDITDVSGYFYRLVRSHDVHKVLTHARMLFADYLRTQPWN